MNGEIVELVLGVQHEDRDVLAMHGALLGHAGQPPPTLQRWHRAALEPKPPAPHEHDALRTRAHLPRRVPRDRSAHREADHRHRLLRPEDRIETRHQSRSHRRSGRGLRLVGFAVTGKIGHEQHEVARQILDVADPVHPGAAAAMEQHERLTLAPHPPHHLPGIVRRAAANAGALDRGHERFDRLHRRFDLSHAS